MIYIYISGKSTDQQEVHRQLLVMTADTLERLLLTQQSTEPIDALTDTLEAPTDP